MARNFTLDAQAAKEAGNSGQHITDAGLYTGKLRAAWYEKNQKGTESVHLLFETSTGASTKLALYTHNGKGEPLSSYKTLNALMTCLKLRELQAKPGMVEMWDYDLGGMASKAKDTYPGLLDKPIGLALQGEEYETQSGDVRIRMNIVAPYDPVTNKVAAEVLGNGEAKALAGIAKMLEATPVRKLKKRSSGNSSDHPYAPGSGSDAPFADDDIPF